MATKPTKFPEWASGGSAAITEPTETKKDLGWVAEKPPHQFFNWLQNLYYKWIEWTERATNATVKALTNWQLISYAAPIKSFQNMSYGGGMTLLVAGKHDFGSGWTSGAAISTDGGRTWTASDPFLVNVFAFQAAWNGSVWAIGGQSGYLATSPDGITWTLRTSGIAGSIYSMVWDSTNGLFIASDGSNIITSPTGVTWTIQSSTVGGELAHNGAGLTVCWNGYPTGQIWTSTNGTTWTLQATTLPTVASPAGISFAGGYFWICRQNPGLTALIEKSTDGVTWTSITNLPANLSGLYYVGANQHDGTLGQDGILILAGFDSVGPDGSGGACPVVVVSPDAGATWFPFYFTHSLGLVVGYGSVGISFGAFVGDFDEFWLVMSGGLFRSSTAPIEYLP